MPKNFFRQGFIPIIVLILAGIVIATGGLFVVREQFIKKATSTAKASLDAKKIEKQIKSGEKFSSTDKKENPSTPANSFTYQPSTTASGSVSLAAVEPSFSINPPAGWKQENAGGNIKVIFTSPDKDKEALQPPLTYYNNAQIAVVFIKNDEAESLSLLAEIRRDKARKDGDVIVSEVPVKVNGQDAIAFESKWRDPKSGVWFHQLTYMLIPNKGYALLAQGSAIDSSWGKRVAEIENSLKSITIIY